MGILDFFTGKSRRIANLRKHLEWIQVAGLRFVFDAIDHKKADVLRTVITSQWFFTDIMDSKNLALPEFKNSAYYAYPESMHPLFSDFLKNRYGLTDEDDMFIRDTFLVHIPQYIDMLYTHKLEELVFYGGL